MFNALSFWPAGYVNYRYLSAPSKGFQTIAMRLPQSRRTPLSVRFLTVNIILATLVLGVTFPLHARQVTNQLVCAPPNVRFGAVIIGQSEIQEFVLTNTGETSVTVSAISASSSEFTVSGIGLPATISAGQSITLSVTFAPQSNGSTGAKITITSNANDSNLEVAVQGIGVKNSALTASPSSLSFGAVSVGSSALLSVVVSNSHTWNETITALPITGSAFSVSGPSLPVTLGSGQSVTLSVSFAPQIAGVIAGNIFLTGDSLNIPLSGTGTAAGQLSIAPGTLSFGNVDVGSSTTQPSSMTATGGSVTVSSATSSNSQFSISGVSLPVTINAGQTVSFDVAFAPTTTGADSATLSFASNASNPGSQSLSGTGVLATYSVSLSWNPSNPPVAGYNVYRGTAPGAYSKINSVLDANPAYTDSTVTSGVTYYYAATAVNSSGQESGYSTPVEVSVP